MRITRICFNNNNVSGRHDNFDNFTQNRPYCLYYHLWLQQVPHFRAYAVPSLSDGVAMDSLIYVPAEDNIAKLPVQRIKGRKYGSNEFENTSKEVVHALLIERSIANECRTQMTLASQSSNAEFAQANFLVI